MVELDDLRSLVGASNVLTDDAASPFFDDFRRVFRGRAAAVVRPADTDEVASVLGWAAERDVDVTTQGGNTGLSGGATPDAGGHAGRETILVSLSRLTAIESVDPDRWSMTVQAGATIESMQQAAAAAHRLFAPDWGARGTATIGGAIATDAGGNNVVRYGNMRDQVLGLEVVLADGRIWNGLRSLRKDSSGYDMKQLFVGSEGTLGVITRAVVRLHPATSQVTSALASLSSLDRLMELFALARDVAPDSIVAFELMPEVGVARACSMFDIPHPIDTRSEFYVLVKLAGAGPVTDQTADLLARAAGAHLITDAVIAGTAEQEERLWRIRDELTPMVLYPELHRIGLKMDVAVPIDLMGAFHDGVREIASELVPSSIAYGFGHVGDGNLHMNVLPAEDDIDTFRAAKDELVHRIDELTFSMGGTLSAEHGVGRELRARIHGQKPAIEWELMRSIKAVFDPDDRLNPGVLFPDRP